MTDSILFNLSSIKINAYLLNGEDNTSTEVLIQFPIIEYGSQSAKLAYNLLDRIIFDGSYSIGNFECGLIPEITKYFHNGMSLAVINNYATKLVELQEKAKELDMIPNDFKKMVVALAEYYNGILAINCDDLYQFELQKNITDMESLGRYWSSVKDQNSEYYIKVGEQSARYIYGRYNRNVGKITSKGYLIAVGQR